MGAITVIRLNLSTAISILMPSCWSATMIGYLLFRSAAVSQAGRKICNLGPEIPRPGSAIKSLRHHKSVSRKLSAYAGSYHQMEDQPPEKGLWSGLHRRLSAYA